jgi:hypothetical protein
VKIPFDLNSHRVTSSNKILKDDVDYVFVKNFDVPE